MSWIKTKKTNTNEKQLLSHILTWGIDIWLFDQVFMDVKQEKDYVYYQYLWKEMTRIRMTEEAFEKTKRLLKEYKKNNV